MTREFMPIDSKLFFGFGYLLISISILFGVNATHNLVLEKRETWSLENIRAQIESDDDQIFTSYWDFSKLMLIAGEICSPSEKFPEMLGRCRYGVDYPVSEENEILFIAQNPDVFPSIYPNSLEILFEVRSEFDFEPVEKIEYWPNELHFYSEID
jgi:hypothetical protein